MFGADWMAGRIVGDEGGRRFLPSQRYGAFEETVNEFGGIGDKPMLTLAAVLE